MGRYGKFHVIIFLSHILHWPFPSIDFYIAKKIFCSTCKYFCFESDFKNIPNNVDLYNDVRKLYNLPKSLTFEWKFLFNTTYTFELIIPFQVKFYSNMLKCVNFIEIRSYAYLYASSFLVYNLWDHCTDTGSWISGEIRIYEGKYWYLRNNQHWLLAIIGHAKTNILQQNMW